MLTCRPGAQAGIRARAANRDGWTGGSAHAAFGASPRDAVGLAGRCEAPQPPSQSRQVSGSGAHTFESLRLHRNYRLYFVGQFASQAGNWILGAAQVWLVLELTRSAVAVGLVSFWQYIPYSVLGLLGAGLSDRLDHRRTLIITQALFAACAAALAAIAFARHTGVDWVYALAVVRGVVLIFSSPSLQALMVQMVGREELANAISLNSGVSNAARVLGPGIAGVIIATAGVGVCFALSGVLSVAASVTLYLMRPAEFFPLQRLQGHASLLRDLREGLGYARRTPQIFLPLVLLAVISVASINFGVLLPLLASQTLHSGAEVYGLLSALLGVGAVAGALASAALNRSTWTILLVAAGGFSLGELLLAPQKGLLLAIVFLVATGVCYTLYTSSTATMVQLAAPDSMQGRVAGLYNYIFLGTAPLGALVAGALCQAGGTPLAFAVAGSAGLAATGLALFGLHRAGQLASAAGGSP